MFKVKVSDRVNSICLFVYLDKLYKMFTTIYFVAQCYKKFFLKFKLLKTLNKYTLMSFES